MTKRGVLSPVHFFFFISQTDGMKGKHGCVGGMGTVEGTGGGGVSWRGLTRDL